MTIKNQIFRKVKRDGLVGVPECIRMHSFARARSNFNPTPPRARNLTRSVRFAERIVASRPPPVRVSVRQIRTNVILQRAQLPQLHSRNNATRKEEIRKTRARARAPTRSLATVGRVNQHKKLERIQLSGLKRSSGTLCERDYPLRRVRAVIGLLQLDV